MGRLVLVTGGARSGKSRHAETLAAATGRAVIYLATMDPADDAELALRVSSHRARRPGAWRTVEEPFELARTIESFDPDAAILLDCLTLWVSNRLFRSVPDSERASAEQWKLAAEMCLEAAAETCASQAMRSGDLIAVTNEVGMGIVPSDALSRAFRDTAGQVNQRFAESADEVFFMVSGRALKV